MLKKMCFVLIAAALHGGLCRVISVLLLKVSANSALQPEPGVGLSLLVTLAKILYLPIIGLGLYPRHWFPGTLIAIPLMLNSLLWGIGIYLLVQVALKFRTRSA